MSKKKTLLVVLAMLMVCVLSVAGTLAYLNATTEAVVNTFVAAAPGEDDFVKSFTLSEYKINGTTAGVYTEDATQLVKSNNYGSVMPGTDLPKTVVIDIADKNAAPAYLYVEVVNKLDESIFTWSMNDSWIALPSAAGSNGGVVYVYTEDGTNPAVITADKTITGVLTGNTIAVANQQDLKLADGANTLTFYGYLCQSTVGSTSDATEVYNTCF